MLIAVMLHTVVKRKTDMKISRETLHQLIENKLCQAGLKREHAATVAEVLVYADARGSLSWRGAR